MKKFLLCIIPISVICTIGIFTLSNASISDTEPRVKDNQEIEGHPAVLSMTKSIELPKHVNFAGEKLELDRYDIYERFDREINSFTYFHSTSLMLIKKANRYFPIIEPILKKNNIPDDFKYLAVIESNLNPSAMSPARAVGLWQFMPKTGTQFGLEVGTQIDERYSVEKATEAACKYFHQAHRKYGNWADVALSYNAGQGRISGELEKQQASKGLDLWLVEETTRYYFRMVAIKYIFEDPAKYGFILNENQLYRQISTTSVEVKESIEDLAEFAKEHGITYAQLRDFNLWIRDRKLTLTGKKAYQIAIPTKESLYYSKGKTKVHNKAWITKK